MQEQIKNLRIRIDGISQLVKELKPIENKVFSYYTPETGVVTSVEYSNSKEIEKSYDSLILAKAWLGKVLQELGTPTPYKSDGNRHSKEDIEPTADTLINRGDLLPEIGDNNWKGYDNLNHIEKVDWLRQEIQILANNIIQFTNDESWKGYFACLCFQYLSEARFWLGFELGRLKEE